MAAEDCAQTPLPDPRCPRIHLGVIDCAATAGVLYPAGRRSRQNRKEFVGQLQPKLVKMAGPMASAPRIDSPRAPARTRSCPRTVLAHPNEIQ